MLEKTKTAEIKKTLEIERRGGTYIANVLRVKNKMEIQDKRDDGSKDFVPMRKSLKRKSTGKEDNFMWSYYTENESVRNFTEEDIEEFRWKKGIHVEGESCPKPVKSFNDMNLSTELLQFLNEHNLIVPTPIQMQAVSCAMSGRDVIGLAETGSGKTLAYTLPLCMLLRTKEPCKPGESPVALLLTPTRELMQQVFSHVSEMLEILKYSGTSDGIPDMAVPRQSSVSSTASLSVFQNLPPRNTLSQNQYYLNRPQVHFSGNQTFDSSAPNIFPVLGNSDLLSSNESLSQGQFMPSSAFGSYQEFHNGQYKAVAVCGGVPISSQVSSLRQGADIIVATPGRLLDLCERGALSLKKITYLVMDEADRMLGMGMEEQLRKIVGLATGTMRARQTLLWSATLPESLERLARSAVLNPVTIQVGPGGLIAPSVQQNVAFLHHYQKPQKLLQTLRTTPHPPVIVFASSIQNVDYVVDLLKKEQFHASGIHSEKSQDYRFKLVSAFRNGKVDVLVGTDVASRGLDFPEVTHIINYDLPDTIEDYVHRCGRTGRMGHPGISTSFLTLDCTIAQELKEMLEIMEQPVPKELETPKQFGKKIIRTEFGDRIIN